MGDSQSEKLPADLELRKVNERLLLSAIREQELAATLEAERARLDVILNSIGDAVVVVDPDGRPVLTNTAYRWMMGDPEAEVVIEDEVENIVLPEDALWQRAAHGESFTLEFSTLTLDGARRWWEANGQPIGSEPGSQGGVVVIRDVSARKRLEQALHHEAIHDALTGLPNRTLLRERLEQALQLAQRTGESLALLLMDLDRFKDINDTLGHHAGDLLLREIATRLLLTVRVTDTVARMGGDEFAILLRGTQRNGALDTIIRIRENVSAPISIEQNIVVVRASIGVVLSLGWGADAATLLRQADEAMYDAKWTQRGHTFYVDKFEE